MTQQPEACVGENSLTPHKGNQTSKSEDNFNKTTE